ncbi:phosphoenolpyruvate protein phosphotransferase [Candidatus Rickettsiella viridis]|uniref:phosphoenolpyruvate--protein phosphotransferase n=1 Tax=Candidatus Rickettsiella viridis TaxID=676208 RepID=A0A2Z5UU36_9COXI|nr:phosphoenolpyruvate--protein phosphotransferase [Candidatus Rickettsiella viridis]BBB14565.1 phosphoenolpyruvate protein phosphotransferase [Candidatus Rickettsiella viridis]
MLKVLRRIVQEVSSAQRFEQALQILVSRVREALHTQSCTVFLLDDKKIYVLLATDGLNPSSVGKVRLTFDQGLVGLIGRTRELINIDNAPEHSDFFYVQGLGEERYKAFLGVPIVHNRALLGVLVVQQEEQRCFDETEEAFLVTMAAQLGGVLAHAEATGEISFKENKEQVQADIIFQGIASAPGISVGQAVVAYPFADLEAVPHKKVKNISAEVSQLKKAFKSARNDIQRLKKHMLSVLPEEEQALFDVYLMILDKASLEKEVIKVIQETQQWAQAALQIVIASHVLQFERVDDDYLRERAADLRDLGRRILMHLQHGQLTPILYPEKTILVGEEVSPSALAEVPEGRLVGIVSVKGSSHSHLSILARSLGIPAITGVENLPVNQLEAQTLIVDGAQGKLIVAPSAPVKQSFIALIEQQREFSDSLEPLRDLPAETLDGYSISLWVNTGLMADANLSLTAGAEGIGLYRTEMPFLIRDCFPAEDEQYGLYRQLLTAFSPRPVVMRTLDIGGDKALPYFPIKEDNPFLGWRGIRVTLDHPEIFLIQIRAMLRANRGLNNLRIMLPMISCVAEADHALRLINQAYEKELSEDPNACKPPIGIMIEVPSAIYQAHALAERVEFLSVGSNDLTQYMLAVDRNNPRVANLYDPFQPSVLQALVQVVEAAHQAQKPVSICGEMASDPLAIPLLLAMGFDALSMNSFSIPRIKSVIRHISFRQAKVLLAQVLKMDNAKTIRDYLGQALASLSLKTLASVEVEA